MSHAIVCAVSLPARPALKCYTLVLLLSLSGLLWAQEPEHVPAAVASDTAAAEPEQKDPDEELGLPALVDELVKQIGREKPDAIWDAVNRLARLGRKHGAAVTDRLERELASPNAKVQLAAARALCQVNNIERAAPVLTKLAEKGESADIRRLAVNAIGLTTPLYGEERTTKALLRALKNETDDLTRISIARSLWRVASRSDGRDELLRIMSQTPDKAVKDEAALVLAENGFLHLAEVRLRLLNLYTEPTAQGERAFNLLRHFEDENGRGRDSKLVQGEQLMREVLRAVKNAYPDESKYDLDKLFEDAAKGLVGGLDPFSQYMDRDEVKATQEILQQDYGGIGAYVGTRNNAFVITSPIYGAPADRAGLRALDVIQEVDGMKTHELLEKGGLNGVIARLKGQPGTMVRVKYYRRGFVKPVEVTIAREKIRVETVFSTMLPGDIAYIRLTRFGEHSSEEMQKALDSLVKQQKARGLVLDMRDNPGGLLRAGVEISDKFLQADRLIVYSEGNKDFAPRKDYFATGGPEDEAYPMVALVGAGSASASEIVAGALQDHKRAVLVGEKTFGKGSVQQIMPIRATDRQTQLRLTVAKYYLPSGRCIHEKGVEADVEAREPETQSWAIEKIIELRRQALFEDHVRNTWDQHKDLYAKLALCDENKCECWPGFDELYKSLHTRLEPNDIRVELRSAARRRLQDELKRELVVDLEEDDVLQRGVFELLKKLNVDPQTFVEYKTLPDKFRKKDDAVQEGAMLPDSPKATPK